MLDYNVVKKFHAKKLAEDAEGDGRVESAFYHTMKMVYLKGVEDGEQAARHAEASRDKIVGINDNRANNSLKTTEDQAWT
jgi:hypothetical protein